eukprot:g782.t1
MDIIPGISQNLIFAWSNGPVFEYHGRENRGYVVGMSWGQSSRSVGGALVDEEGRPEADDGNDSNDGYETWPDQVVVDFINEPYEIDHHRDTILVHTHFIPPEGGDWAIARIEQISDDALVMFHHHMLFYGCSEIPAVNNVSREERGEAFCNEILAVSPGFGLAVGGASSVQGFRVEVHYDGLTPLTSNLLDPGAGYRVTFVPNDGRIQEMGVLITGTFGLMIPSNLPRTDERNHFYGVCNIPDTIPDEGVTVLYNFWHMHLRGRGMYTRHIRNGVELEPLGRNNFYDWWYQGPGGEAPVGRKLLPGDQLIINCFYDTRARTSSHERGSSTLAAGDITTFGEGTNDEMCFDFIAYYPRHPDLTNCFDGMGQGPAENAFDRRERNLKGSSTALMTFDSDAQEEAFLTAVRSDSPWVRMLLGEKLMSSIRSSFDEKDATGLVERRHEAFDFGATSEVYRCKGKRNNREYACKIIDKRKMFSRQRHRCNPGVRMKAEIINCSKLKHPHLIDIVDVFETGDSIYVLMELMHGGQLFNYVIERNSLTEKEASDIIKQVTEALAYMHENGVLHRDLKAENVLLTSSDASKRPFIKVVDFGMSKEVNGAKTSSVLGTPGYQAPECMLGQKYSTAVDCFSLGCLTYILLCGYMPLYTDEGTDSQKVIFPESEWADISEDARDFVSNLIEYEPEKRLSCADALKHKWLSDSMLPPSGPPSLTLSPSLKSVDFLSHPLTEKGRLSRVQSTPLAPSVRFAGAAEASIVSAAYKMSSKRPRTEVRAFRVDLDLSPRLRWKGVCEAYGGIWKKRLKPYMQALRKDYGAEAFRTTVNVLRGISSARYPEILEEMTGLASLSKGSLSVDDLIFLHFMYEVTQGCTAIVCREISGGDAFIGRTLDWHLPILRELTIEVHFCKGKRLLFVAPSWAGYVGVLTVVRPHAYAVAVNFRVSREDLSERLGIPGASPIGFLLREVAERRKTYDAAIKVLSTSALLARAFFIVCDAESRGCVVTRTPTKEESRISLGKSRTHLVQANLAHWVRDDASDIQESLPRTRLVAAHLKTKKRITLAEMWTLLGTFPIWEKGYSVYASVLRPKGTDGVYSTTRILSDDNAD